MPIIPPPTIRVILDPAALATIQGGSGRGLKRITPEVARRDHAFLSQTATVFHINTPERLAHWFGQIVYESAGGGLFTEVAGGGTGSSRSDSVYRGQGYAQVSGSSRVPNGPLVLPGNFAAYERYLASRDRFDYDFAPPARVVRTPELLATHPYNCHSAGWYMGVGGFMGVRERRDDRVRVRFPDVRTMPWDAAFQVADDEGVTQESCLWMTFAGWRPAYRYAFSTSSTRFQIAQSALRAFQNGGARFVPCSGRACLETGEPAPRPSSGFRFRRMGTSSALPGLALISNVFTRPKAYLGGANVPDVADYVGAAVAKLNGDTSKAYDLSWAAPDKRFGFEKSGDHYDKDGAYTPAPDHIRELP